MAHSMTNTSHPGLKLRVVSAWGRWSGDNPYFGGGGGWDSSCWACGDTAKSNIRGAQIQSPVRPILPAKIWARAQDDIAPESTMRSNEW